MVNLLRMNMTVSDLDKTLTFYRDILGMKVTADKELISGVVSLLGVPGGRCRLIRLKDETSKEANVGLFSFISPPLKPREEPKAAAEASARDIYLLFIASEFEELEIIDKKLKEAGVKDILRRFVEEGPDKGKLRLVTFLAPDGVRVEVFKRLDR